MFETSDTSSASVGAPNVWTPPEALEPEIVASDSDAPNPTCAPQEADVDAASTAGGADAGGDTRATGAAADADAAGGNRGLAALAEEKEKKAGMAADAFAFAMIAWEVRGGEIGRERDARTWMACRGGGWRDRRRLYRTVSSSRTVAHRELFIL